jgi:hypothetical protein
MFPKLFEQRVVRGGPGKLDSGISGIAARRRIPVRLSGVYGTSTITKSNTSDFLNLNGILNPLTREMPLFSGARLHL